MSSAVRSLLVALGLAVAALGAALTTRPFTSIDVLVALVVAGLVTMSLGQLIGAPRPWTWAVRISAVAWLTAAIVIATQPGIGVSTLAVIVGFVVVLEGVARVFGGGSGTANQRFASTFFGLTGIILGVLALSWPDVTILVVAVLFGIRVLWFGLSLFWTGVRGTFDEAEPFEPGSLRRITTAVASALALVLAVTLGGVSYWLHEGRPDELGALEIPTEVPKEPGKLISFAEFDTNVPRGASAWRILYTTTRDDGKPALSTALILASDNLPSGPRPVIAWAHGTTGIETRCAPSSDPSAVTFASIPAMDDALDNGWVIVATDYIGLGTPGPHPYLIGQGEGRSVLDSVRAAHEFSELSLSDKTVVWGHSQGGGAALWTGILAPTYAPDVDLLGVAGIAPASDLIGLVDHIVSSPFGYPFAAYVIDAYSETYPDVSFGTYVRPGAQEAMRKFAETCVAERQVLGAIYQDAAFKQAVYAAKATSGALGRRLRENIPDGRISVPTFIAQGESDLLVLPSVQKAFVAARCARSSNGPLDYRVYPDRDHTDIINRGSAMLPDLLSWTQDRYAGKTAPSTC